MVLSDSPSIKMLLNEYSKLHHKCNNIAAAVPKTTTAKQFHVAGIMANASFQKARYCVEKLHGAFPDKYAPPHIHPMFNVEWDEYLINLKHRVGADAWLLQKPVAILLDGELLGNDDALFRDVSTEFDDEFGDCHVFDYIDKRIVEGGRKFVYLTVAVDQIVIGAMLFELYSELVPITCSNFLQRCHPDDDDGYKGTSIHRIVKNGWIQCGGWHLKHRPMICENYIIPHNRRGVLSMCNSKRHRDNSTQFFINLTESATWMDYRYVAFGQLIQGAEILNQLEQLPTYYQTPLTKTRQKNTVVIHDCGEYTPYEHDHHYSSMIVKHDRSFDPLTMKGVEWCSNHSDESILNARKYQAGKYCLPSDLKSYFPFFHLPSAMRMITSAYPTSDYEGDEEEVYGAYQIVR